MEKYSNCGRILNRKMSMREICNYLEIDSCKSKDYKKSVYKEFGKLEKDYTSQNVDFALNSDLKDNCNMYNYKIIKTGKLVSAFTM